MRYAPLTQSPSPNFDDRAGGAAPSVLVLHYTDLPDAETSRQWMCDPAKKVSSHYLVDLDGSVIQLVDEDKRAWHAGQSYWRGMTDLNTHSIGIEIQNTGHSLGYVPFPDLQIGGVIALCHDILGRHDIPARNIVAHSDIAPARKQDPGHLFPWRILAAAGIGLWPAEKVSGLMTPQAFMAGLAHIGYDPSLPPEVLVPAFQRHFDPEAFDDDEVSGIVTARTMARLSGLIGLIDAT
ncbi:MAG: N-acetylmuramoyl-L-alanine amidase [Alphaproteobacteria bacterium]